MRLAATLDLLKRYAAVWRAAWDIREELDPKERLAHEAQFLPAALELQETPPSPIPRATMWTLIVLCGFALLWSIFGKIDVVAVAQGKIIPDDRTKTIQAPELAVIRKILVRDGQLVKAGDSLVELDATVAGADAKRLDAELEAAELALARAQALYEALNSGKPPKLQPLRPPTRLNLADQQRLLLGEYQEVQAKLATLDEETARRQAELETTRELVAKLADTLPLVKQRAEDFRGLADKNFVAKHALLEKEQALVETQRDLAAQRSKEREIQHAIAQNQQQRISLLAEAKRSTLDQLNQAKDKASSLKQELVKAEQRRHLLTLTAPVDGVVQQLAVHTIGGVLKEAEPLMQIVPKQGRLVVEAWVENKDIGFVYADQQAEVKVETFNFTKYGTIDAKVLTVSNDAVQDEKRGLTYPIRLELSRSQVRVEKKDVNLAAGMAVSAEIKIGKRRVIEYFLSPLSEHLQESLRER